MTLGTGIGGGIVAEGKLLHGVAGAAELDLDISQLTDQSHVLVVKAVLRQWLFYRDCQLDSPSLC